MGKIIYHKRSYGSSLGGGGDIDSSDIPTSNMIAEFDNNAHMNSADMSNNEIEDFVESLDISAVHAVDYVVEQGTEGIWTYRKWNSGIAECWGKWSGTLTHYANPTTAFYAYYTSINFPTSLFISVPVVTYAARIGSGFAMAGTITSSLSATSNNYYAVTINTNGSQTVEFYIQVKGRWK